MEINKAPVSSQYLASLLRQRDVAAVPKNVDAVAEAQPLAPEKRDSRRQAMSANDLRSALDALEESQASRVQVTQRDGVTLNNRARMALNAYTTQENQARDETSRSLRDMLGVDIYA